MLQHALREERKEKGEEKMCSFGTYFNYFHKKIPLLFTLHYSLVLLHLATAPEGQIVPVTIRVARPGVRVYAPVPGFWVKVAAGTVMTPGTVVKSPVVSS